MMKSSCGRYTLNRSSNFRIRLLPVIGAIGLLVLSACNSGRPDDLIEEDTYIDLIVEINLLHAVNNRYEDTDKTLTLQQQVLDEYGISHEQFVRSHEYYLQDVDAQRERVREGRERLTKIINELNTEYRERQQEEAEESSEED